MADKIRPERVTRGDLARDFRVDFLKLAPSRNFETSSHAVKKIIGSHFKCNLMELTTRSTSFTRAVSGLLDMRQDSSWSWSIGRCSSFVGVLVSVLGALAFS